MNSYVSGNRTPVSTVRISRRGSTCNAMWMSAALSAPNDDVSATAGRNVSTAQRMISSGVACSKRALSVLSVSGVSPFVSMRFRRPRGRNPPVLFQVREDRLEAVLFRLLSGIHHNFCFQWRLVRVRDAGEVLELAGQRLLVEPFDIPPGQLLDRALHVHFDELADLLTVVVANLAVGRDRRADGHDPVARQQLADIADALDVRVAVLLAEPQPLAEVREDLIAVENFHLEPPVAQLLGEMIRQRRLPGD